jgi:hypothetical protein
MELDWYRTGAVGMKQQSCWGVLWVSNRPQVSRLKRQRNLHLMPHNKHSGKQGCNCQDHKIFNPHKIARTTFTLQPLFMFSASVFHNFLLPIHLVIYQLLLFYCQFSGIRICSSCQSFWICFYFCFVYSVSFDYSVLFSVLILEMYSRYFYPHINNHPASQ